MANWPPEDPRWYDETATPQEQKKLVEAHAAGAIIEAKGRDGVYVGYTWGYCENPRWDFRNSYYRIKPEEKKVKDRLGKEMKRYEQVETNRRANIAQPLMARLDGRSFHSFTQGLNRPYDEQLSRLMIDTTKYLVSETNALLGYTQSDEISLVWNYPVKTGGQQHQYLFDGRFQKLTSVLAATATGYFVHHLEKYLPSKRLEIPVFDCRVWQVPDLKEACRTFQWREKDAVKNSITMAALAFFSHKKLDGVNSKTKREWLIEQGAPWEAMPRFFKQGTYVKHVKSLKELSEEELMAIPSKHRPTGPVERCSVQEIELTLLGGEVPEFFNDDA